MPAGAGLLLALAAGCGHHMAGLDRTLMADREPGAHCADPAVEYGVHCPDALTLTVDGLPQYSGERVVAADGRIALDDHEMLRVEGLTVAQISDAAAQRLGLPPDRVKVSVSSFNSEQIFLFGEVNGLKQVVPYRGPETVVDVLQRAGGVSPGAAPRDVKVVRAHVSDAKGAEVFKVDLPAILVQHDQKTNVTLRPYDKVYIGESRQSKVRQCLPPWLRSLYDSCCGIQRDNPPVAETPAPRAE